MSQDSVVLGCYSDGLLASCHVVQRPEHITGFCEIAQEGIPAFCDCPRRSRTAVGTGVPHSGQMPEILPVKLYLHMWQVG